MKALHYVPVVFSYLLTLLVAIMAGSEFSEAFAHMRTDASIWAGASRFTAGLISLGLAYFLWIWASRVRANARISLALKDRLGAEGEQLS